MRREREGRRGRSALIVDTIRLALVVVVAGWMLYDGTRALVTGDYVRPASGPFAGQLGPWSHIVSALHVNPTGHPMKVTFVIFGVSGLAAAAGFVGRAAWASRTLLAWSVASMWYLPAGTIAGVLHIAAALLTRSRERRA